MTSITSASGATYVQVEVDEKATIDEIASAACISGTGINLYEVQKKEEVSAAKSLLLFVGPTAQWIDGAEARSKLGLAGAKAAVTPALVVQKAGAGSKLWVQSTSSNRALPEGSSLIKAVAGGASAGKSGSAAAKPAAKGKAASKRKADEDDDEGEEEEEEEKPSKKAAPAKRARKAADEPAAAPAAAAGGKKKRAAAAMDDEDEDSAPAAAAGGNIKIVGSSGASYVLIPVAEKAQVDEICARAGIACNTGLYEVGGKKEDVSAQKELVLLTVPAASAAGSTVNDDYTSIRKLLGMGAGKASINAATVKAKAGPHARLFVQSTSGNRGILAGTLLCVKQDYGLGGGAGADAGAGGVAAAAGGAGASGGPVSLASIFAAHYGGSGAAGAKEAPTTKAGKRSVDEDDEEDDAAMEDEGGSGDKYGFASPEFRSHKQVSSANFREARSRFLSQSNLGRWTSSRGHRFLVRATCTDLSGDDWPLAWYGHESQPVAAAAFFLPEGSETNKSIVAPLAMVWLVSLTADESASAYLQAYEEDGNELDGILDGGNHGVLETVVIGLNDDVMDGFCVSSGSDAMPALNCPALEGLTVGEVESGRVAAGTAATGSTSSPSAGGAPAVGSNGSTVLRSSSGDACYMLLPVTAQSTVAAEISKSAVPKSDVSAAFYELAEKTEDVSAKKAMVLWNPSSASVVDDASAIRVQLGVGAGNVSLSASQVSARVGAQAKLFVQSTSTNRALQPGSMLCLKLQGAAAAKALVNAKASSSSSASSSSAAAASSAAAGSASSAAVPNEFMPALQFIDWARLCNLDGGFNVRTIFPADSAWVAERSQSSELRSDRRPIEPVKVRAAQSLIDTINAGGFSTAGSVGASTSAAAASTTTTTEGWFRDARLEDRIHRLVLREKGSMAQESLVVTAHLHSASPFPGSRSVICIEIGKDEGADVLVATNAQQWMVVARHTNGHMLLECNSFEARLDPSRRLIVRDEEDSGDDDEGEAARGPRQQLTDVNSPQNLIQTLERHFKNVVAGKLWA